MMVRVTTVLREDPLLPGSLRDAMIWYMCVPYIRVGLIQLEAEVKVACCVGRTEHSRTSLKRTLLPTRIYDLED